MADVVYNRAKLGMLNGDYNLASGGDTIKTGLVTSSYTVNQDSHEDWADITGEFSDASYTAGGETLAGQTTSQDNTDNEGVFDGTNETWSSLDGGTADAAIQYKSTGVSTTSLLLWYIDSGGFPVTANGGDFTIQWAAEGIANLN